MTEEVKLKLVLRNPASSLDFPLEVGSGTTIEDLHRIISEQYPGKPAVNQQTVRSQDTLYSY